jgi:glycosyltransferase involved in cell wall biosynthesis
MRVIHVPIEPYPTRYTADWVQQFESAFKVTNTQFITVLGNQSVNTITSGSVLDACGTHMYKFSQLEKLMFMILNKEITENDVIFFSDLWFPGLESLFYVRAITGIDFKIAGVFHAGTWDPHDFTSRTGMRDWGQHLETSWLHGVDMIFVATQWHKDLIVINSEDFDESKIFVTGIPFYSEKLRDTYFPDHTVQIIKEKIVVFPHRLDIEKHPEKFDRIAKKYPQWSFVKTIDATKNREEYFNLLSRSKVMISFAEQETFGYSTVESMALGNFVIVPNQLSYREIVPDGYRYNNEKEIPEMLEKFMASDELPYYPDLNKWAESIERMIHVMSVKIREAAKKRKEFEDAATAEQARVEAEKKLKREKSRGSKDTGGTEA